MKTNKIPKFSPRTNTKVYDVEVMSAQKVNGVCAKASLAFESCKRTILEDRKKYLRNLVSAIRNNSERIIQSIILDVEKPFCEAENEVIEGCDILEYYCSEVFEGIDTQRISPFTKSITQVA